MQPRVLLLLNRVGLAAGDVPARNCDLRPPIGEDLNSSGMTVNFHALTSSQFASTGE
jgi:hypothetical protein